MAGTPIAFSLSGASPMTTAFALFLIVHGLLHLLGAAKAFGWAELPQVTQPIPVPVGVLWLVAALLYGAAAVLLFLSPRWWWTVGLLAVLVSTAVIASSWADAKPGLAVTGLAFIGVVFGFLSHGPASLRSQYDRDVARTMRPGAPAVVSEDDLTGLPPLVQRYLRGAGVVGQPRVRNFLARMHGRIRDDRDGRWMPFESEQHNVVVPPARLFYLNASMIGLPVQGYHRYVDAAASMRVKAAALVPVVDAGGDTMTRAETVTVFNDMCILAPATLLEPSILWQTVDSRSVRASYTNGAHAISAVLSFNDAGDLVDFVSDDRYRSEPDGKPPTRMRWSTPIGHYRRFGASRLASRGQGLWHDAAGQYAYIELTIDDVHYNVNRAP